MGRWETDNTWNIVRFNGTTATTLGSTGTQPALVADQTYRVRLEMTGTSPTTLQLYVNGVLKVGPVTDSTAAEQVVGRAGIMNGEPGTIGHGSTTTGLHLDNFQVTPSTYPRAADSKGSNTGDYENGVTQGVAGAIAGDPNTAARFDGVNDYVQMTGTTGIPVGASSRSVEAWFKTSSAARQVLFDYGNLNTNQEFGLWVDPGGTTMTAWGWGGGNDKTFTMPSAVSNGVWHQVVLTWNGTTLILYIDGVALAPQTATRDTVMDAHGFGIGAVVNPDDTNSGGFFNGSIDDVSLYTSVLSPATVITHYLLGSAVPDVTGPIGGSVDATGLVGTGARYATSTTLNLALAAGTDLSGIATTGNLLQRASASITDGTCGTFGSYAVVATDPTSPTTDAVTDQALLPLPVRRERHRGQRHHLHQPRHQGRRDVARRPVPGLLGADQRVMAGQRLDGLLPVRRHLGLDPPHRHGERTVRHRRLRVPGAGQRVDVDPGWHRRDDVLLERGEPRGPRHQVGDRHQQRRHDLGRRAVHAHRGRHRADR